MKIELDFNLEDVFYEDDGTTLKDVMQDMILRKIVDRLYNDLQGKFQVEISKTITKKIEHMLEKTYSQFLNSEVNITDQYGDIKTTGTVKEILKKRFDNWLNEYVDENGRPTSYGDKRTRLEHVIKKQLEKHSQQFTKEAVENVANKLEETLSEDLRSMIGKKIADKIGLNKLLPKIIR